MKINVEKSIELRKNNELDRIELKNKRFEHLNKDLFNVHFFNSENELINVVTLNFNEILFLLKDLKFSENKLFSNDILRNLLLKNKVIYL